MTLPLLTISLILPALIIALVLTHWRPALIFAGAMAATYFCGLVSTEELLSKAVNTGLATLVLLMLASIALDKICWISRFGQHMVNGHYTSSLAKIMTTTAGLSAFINNTAVVAAFISSLKNNSNFPASRLLIPMAYAATLGGTMTLIGTSTNLIVNSFLIDSGQPGLSFFSFFAVGSAATVGGVITLLFSSRLLPSYNKQDIHTSDYLIETRVSEASPLIGKSISENGLRNLDALFLAEIVREGQLISPVPPKERIHAGDILIFAGEVDSISQLNQFEGLQHYAADDSPLLSRNLVEVVLLPQAMIVGKTLLECGFRSMFDAAVLGIRRGGQRLSGKLGTIRLMPGDSLILATGDDFASRKNLDRNFAVIDNKNIQRELPPRASTLVLLGFMATILMAATGAISLFKALAAFLVVALLTKVITPEEVKRRFPFDIWLIITSALVLAQALNNSGLASATTDLLLSQLQGFSPLIALASVYLFTLVMTEAMTNNAAAALAFPFAYSLATSLGVSPLPFVMAVAFGASASFLTPFGYNTNLMIQNVCGYRFADYTRTGLPLTIVYSAIVLTLLPRVFPL